MKKLIFILMMVLLFIPSILFSQETAVHDSTDLGSNKDFREGTVGAGMTDENIARLLRVDTRGALMSAVYDSVTTDTLTTVGTDTIPVTDDYWHSFTIKPTVDIKVRTNKFPADKWIFIESSEWVSLPIYVANGDTVFVSTAGSLPQVQIIRGRMK